MFTAHPEPKKSRRQRRNQSGKAMENFEPTVRNQSTFSIHNSEKICRICLKDAEIPIYGGDSSSNISEDVQMCADIDLKVTDVFPKYLCVTCYSLLESAILLRKLANETAKWLQENQMKQEVLSGEHLNEFDNNNEDYYEMEIPKVYKCNGCELNFETNEEYSAHKNSKQHRNLRIQCPTCQRVLTARMYKRHLARHDSAALICEICGKMYRKDNLMRHLQLHTFELPYQCEICPYRGRYVDSLKIHMRSHTGDKPFSCDKCQLRFLTRSNLNRHLLTHKKDKPFKCNECNRGFYMKRDLDIHFKADHAGIKEYSCKMCGNKYGTRKALMRHEIRVHKRDKMSKGRLPLYLQAEYRQNYETQ